MSATYLVTDIMLHWFVSLLPKYWSSANLHDFFKSLAGISVNSRIQISEQETRSDFCKTSSIALRLAERRCGISTYRVHTRNTRNKA